MSEKIIVLHPENQPEVDIYPIIKEGSIPNSVIDNQKIKSRTIINSNIALNTLKYEVLHQTLKDLIDSKITQVNMENYLTSYYYNVEETQQYVGSEINTLHQTIQNEFYSKTAIDNMLMEKTDLSLFRQYLPGTFLDLDKQQDNQTSKLNIHADGSIFLTNSGNKINSGNYYLPNSIVKTEDAPNGYYVLSTTNDDYQSLYNLGAYDKITTNSDGTYTITRQTGYVDLGTLDWNIGGSEESWTGLYFRVNLLQAKFISLNQTNAIVSSRYNVVGRNSINIDLSLCIDSDGNISQLQIKDNSFAKTNEGIAQFKASLQGIMLQYELVTSYTEKVEKNHYARYNQRFILEHNKSEAERSANLLPPSCFYPNNNIQSDGSLGTYDGYSCYYKVPVKPNTTYIASRNGGIISNNLGVAMYDSNGTFLKYVVWSGSKGTTENNVYYISFDFLSSYTNIILNEGSVALPYQPYEGKTIHEKDLENTKNEINNAKQDKLVNEINIKSINGNSILGSGDLSVIADSVFTKLENTTSYTINRGTKYLVVAINKPVIVKGENTNYGNQGSKTCGGIFMVMMSNIVEGYGQDLYVNTERVFGDEYITRATISGDSFEIYRIN